MTAPLFGYAPKDVETAVIAHLSHLGHPVSFQRPPSSALPFILVTHIAGYESAAEGFADAVISVHTLCDKAIGAPAARDEATKTHRRMLQLITEPEIRNKKDELVATVQYLEVVEPPRWEYYSETILRKTARYRVGLPFVAV